MAVGGQMSEQESLPEWRPPPLPGLRFTLVTLPGSSVLELLVSIPIDREMAARLSLALQQALDLSIEGGAFVTEID